MKVIFEVDSEKDMFEFTAHKYADELYMALLEIGNTIHSDLKYSDKGPMSYDDMWTEYNRILLDNNLNVDILGL